MYARKRYTTSSARQHLAQMLDEAEQGEAVIVERGGVRFRVVTETPKKSPSRSTKPFVKLLDPTLLEKGWTWTWSKHGVSLDSGKKRPR